MKTNGFTYSHTKAACYTGYVVQAIVNNFVPLLFVYFHLHYHIPLIKITFLVTFNFGLQLCTDFASVFFVDRIGYRKCMLFSNLMSAAGLILLTILPELMPNPFTGIILSVPIYAVGGGLLEVLINPIIESCPSKNKDAAMSILHSFYSWGCAGVILISTIFFHFAGIESWRLMAVIWAFIPLANSVLFMLVPIAPFLGSSADSMPFSALAGRSTFWLLLLMMLCAGASEMTVSQWSSAFAETGLHVSKTVGDLAGPLFFAILFGISRTIYGRFGDRLDLIKFMRFSIILCIGAHTLILFSPFAVLSLIGCGLAGFSVGIFWPGTVSIAAKSFKSGGTLMFSLLAFAGDIGCSAGPTFAGAAAAAANDSLKLGIGAAIIFPLLMALGLVLYSRQQKKYK